MTDFLHFIFPGAPVSKEKQIAADILAALKGGKGSGNFGHAGRPGKVGGSASKTGNNLINKTDLGIYKNYNDLPKNKGSNGDTVYWATNDGKLVLINSTHEEYLWNSDDLSIFGIEKREGNPTRQVLDRGAIRVRETEKEIVLQTANVDKQTLTKIQNFIDNDKVGLNNNKAIIWGNKWGDEVIKSNYSDFMSSKYIVNDNNILTLKSDNKDLS